MPEGPITLTLGGAVVGMEPATVAAAFQQSHMVALPGFLDGRFLDLLGKAARHSGFVRETVPGIGAREVETPLRQAAAVLLALRGKTVMNWARTVTGAPELADVGGSVVRSLACANDQLAWHDDNHAPERVAALTIRLGHETYAGGAFEFRCKARPRQVIRHEHVRPGDALLFAVSGEFEHRVLPLRSGGPRSMFTGWFMRGTSH